MPELDIQPLPDRFETAASTLISLALDIFNVLPHPGEWADKYGLRIRFTSGETLVQMNPFCWCEAEDCPWCACHLEEAEGYSAHQILQLRPAFEAEGWVSGHGAPNFRIVSGDFHFSIWWYKYIGRGMSIGCSEELTPAVFARATTLLEGLRQEQGDAILTQAIEARAADMTRTDALAASILTALGAMLAATDPAARQAKAAALHVDLASLDDKARQADEMSALLDSAGVSRHPEEEDLPEDLRMELTPAARLEQLLHAMGRLSEPHPDDGIGF